MKMNGIKLDSDQHQARYNEESNAKNILVVSSCVFTAHGLASLCSNNPEWQVTFWNPANDTKTSINLNSKPDLIIAETACFDQCVMKSLLKHRNLSDKVILLTESYNNGMQNYKTMRGVTYISDKRITIDALENLISKALSYYTVEGDLNPGKHQRARLSEYEVLLSLLNGEKPDNIAQKMGITYNAVSRYKLLALKRAGAKSINEIITGKHTIFVSDFFKSLSIT